MDIEEVINVGEDDKDLVREDVRAFAPVFLSYVSNLVFLNDVPLDVSSTVAGSRSRTLITVKSDAPGRGSSFVADEDLEDENSAVDIFFDAGISMPVFVEDENSRVCLEGVEVST